MVDEIRAAGGEAVANADDIADWDGAGRLIAAAIDAFGTLDTVVCNAGIVRDRMLVNMASTSGTTSCGSTCGAPSAPCAAPPSGGGPSSAPAAPVPPAW